MSRKADIFIFLLFESKSVSEKLCFCDGLVWTVGLTVEVCSGPNYFTTSYHDVVTTY